MDMDRPEELRWLFLDLNSYFASVEQQEDSRLRGRPVIVIPAPTDSTCVIAASYEAKAYGIKTGTPVWEAKRLCPGVILRPARHQIYVAYHHRIVEEVNRHIPVDHVASIDEMACALLGPERAPDQAVRIAHHIKNGLRENLGPCIRASIGIASNVFLAKVGTEIEKPDGLVTLHPGDLPGRLLELRLNDLPGIGRRMHDRLNQAGIETMAQLWTASALTLHSLWGSAVGRDFWYALHGYDLRHGPGGARGSISHSRVLGPPERPMEIARLVARRLTVKAAGRLRRLGYRASFLHMGARLVDGRRWRAEAATHNAADNLTFLQALEDMWQAMSGHFGHSPLRKVSVVLLGLQPANHAIPDLLADIDPVCLRRRRAERLSQIMDQLNRRFGQDTVTLGPSLRHPAYEGTKIAFTRIPDQAEFWE